MRHRAVDIEVDAAAGVARGRGESLSIPAHARPGQLGRIAGKVLLKRTLDAPIVREIKRAPRGVDEARPNIGEVAAEIALGAPGRDRFVVKKRGGGGQQPRVQRRGGERGRGTGGIIAGEAPAGVERNPLANRQGLRGGRLGGMGWVGFLFCCGLTSLLLPTKIAYRKRRARRDERREDD